MPEVRFDKHAKSPAAGAAAPSLGVQHSGRGDETSVPKVERTRRIWRGTERKTHGEQRVVSGGAVLAGAAVRSC